MTSPDPQRTPHTQQHAGDRATQIGSVGGSVIQNFHEKHGFWGCLTFSIVTLAVCITATIALFGLAEHIWPSIGRTDGDAAARTASPGGTAPLFGDTAGADRQGGGVPVWPPEPRTPAVTTGDLALASAVGRPAGLPSHMAPAMLPGALPGFSTGTLQQSFDPAVWVPLVEMAVRIIDQAEINAYSTNNAAAAMTAISGNQLANIQQQIAVNVQNGVLYQPMLLNLQVNGVRLVDGSSPDRAVVDADLCETWQGRMVDMFGNVLRVDPPNLAPQTMRIQFTAAGVMALDVQPRTVEEVCR